MTKGHRFDNDVLRRAYIAVVQASWDGNGDDFEALQALGMEIIELDIHISELHADREDMAGGGY